MSHRRVGVWPAATFLIGALFASQLAVAEAPKAAPLDWQRLPSIPDAIGFAGPFAGTTGGVLLVAGGANFPGLKPWEGGTKVWSDRVFVLEDPAGKWKELEERLPRPLGYGVSISTPDGVICIGGSNIERHFAEVFRLTYRDGKLTRADLPALPQPCANFCGALLDNVIYVAGGISQPDATETLNTFWKLDLSRPAAEQRWEQLATWPGRPRMLATAGVQDHAFFLFSGTDLTRGPDGKPLRKPVADAFRYQPSTGWRKIADLPRPAIAALTPAAAMGAAHLLVLGGDDGSRIGQPPEKHPGFRTDVLAYDTVSDTWATSGTTPAPYVTAPLVQWRGGFIVPGGEVRPGIRITEVHMATPKP